jgi:hypothetical protein
MSVMAGSDSPAAPDSSRRRLPLTLKIACTVFVAVLVPVYGVEYGLTNFLWFSNIALLTTLVALWKESSLLASMMALAVLVFELFWNIEYFLRLLTEMELGISGYMFDSRIPLLVRGLSLYHVVLPALLLFLLYRLGYDRRALF